MTAIEKMARAQIASQTTEQIVEQFEMTENLNTPEAPMVRGWYMDELESRDAEAFWNWVDSNEDSPRAFFS